MSIHFTVPCANDGSSEGFTAMATSESRTHVPSFASTRRAPPTFFERPVSCTAVCQGSSPAFSISPPEMS